MSTLPFPDHAIVFIIPFPVPSERSDNELERNTLYRNISTIFSFPTLTDWEHSLLPLCFWLLPIIGKDSPRSSTTVPRLIKALYLAPPFSHMRTIVVNLYIVDTQSIHRNVKSLVLWQIVPNEKCEDFNPRSLPTFLQWCIERKGMWLLQAATGHRQSLYWGWLG